MSKKHQVGIITSGIEDRPHKTPALSPEGPWEEITRYGVIVAQLLTAVISAFVIKTTEDDHDHGDVVVIVAEGDVGGCGLGDGDDFGGFCDGGEVDGCDLI